MALMVVDGAVLTCPFGMAPSQLAVTSQFQVLAQGKPAATVQDMAGMVNIKGFQMCVSLANPQVQAATTAALGVLTPQPCMFQPAGAWINPGITPLAGNRPCLCSDSKIMCATGMGIVSVASSGQTKVIV